jgi:hypothetical protein
MNYSNALSAHAPSRLRFEVGGLYKSLKCKVAINDDVSSNFAHADFVVMADGKHAAVEPFVRSGEAPRELIADISGAKEIELIVRSSRWEFCHAVWLDPEVGETPAPVAQLKDCLGRCEIVLPSLKLKAEHCIATVVSPGFENFLDSMLGSLYANGNCGDALLVVFILNTNDECERIAAKYQATVVRCKPEARINPMSKALLYSVARVVDAEKFICLDADMIVLDDLSRIFQAMDICADGSIFACREGNGNGFENLAHGLRLVYGGNDKDIEQLSITPEEANYPLVVNDGIFAGTRNALLSLDGVVREMSNAAKWADGNAKVWWRNQFIFNLALARMRCGIELDSTFNVQLHVQEVQLNKKGARTFAKWRGKNVRVLHFSGGAKQKYPELRSQFSTVAEPLVGQGDGDGYSVFLNALRAWSGKYGLAGLAWSFYGLTDGSKPAQVRDPSTFPLFAALHYLIRSNGCVRVLETGTARGISAACFASAVAHREGAKVVTLDLFEHEGRHELWDSLPDNFRNCIEERQVEAITGLKSALDAGEQYDAILLDSIHLAEHVWEEFHLASKLVSEGGLILIHDAIYADGTVDGALRKIIAEGYGLVRLWTAESGVAEDDRLGLAVVENRRNSWKGKK